MDDLAPLCLACHGVCVRVERPRTNGTGPLLFDAVCLRCGETRGRWWQVMQRCVGLRVNHEPTNGCWEGVK